MSLSAFTMPYHYRHLRPEEKQAARQIQAILQSMQYIVERPDKHPPLVLPSSDVPRRSLNQAPAWIPEEPAAKRARASPCLTVVPQLALESQELVEAAPLIYSAVPEAIYRPPPQRPLFLLPRAAEMIHQPLFIVSQPQIHLPSPAKSPEVSPMIGTLSQESPVITLDESDDEDEFIDVESIEVVEFSPGVAAECPEIVVVSPEEPKKRKKTSEERKRISEEHHFYFRNRYTITKDMETGLATITSSMRAGRGRKAHGSPTDEAIFVHFLIRTKKTELPIIFKGAKIDLMAMEEAWNEEHKEEFCPMARQVQEVELWFNLLKESCDLRKIREMLASPTSAGAFTTERCIRLIEAHSANPKNPIRTHLPRLLPAVARRVLREQSVNR